MTSSIDRHEPSRASRHPKGYWTRDRLRDEAAKYKTRREMQAHARLAYKAARRHGLLDEIFADHANAGFATPQTFDDVKLEAAKHSRRSAFMLCSPGAYAKARRNGWLDEVCEHMAPPCRNRPYSLDEVAAVAQKFRSRGEFQRAHSSTYQTARRRGWLDRVCSHMPRIGSRSHRVVYRIWNTESRLLYVGLSHDWRERYAQHLNSPAKHTKKLIHGPHEVEALTDLLPSEEAARAELEFETMYRNSGWHVLNVKRPGSLGSNSRKWTFEKVCEVASMFETRTAMARSHPAYQVALRFGWLDDAFASHPNGGLLPDRKPHGYWTVARLKEVASTCQTRTEMQRNHGSAYMTALTSGLLETIFADHPDRGVTVKAAGYWNVERLKSEANRYATRQDMYETDFPAYHAATNRGLLDVIFANHPNQGRRKKPNGFWTDARLYEEAKRYTSRSEMRENSRSAFAQAKRRGLLDKIFAEHPNEGYVCRAKAHRR